LTVGPVEWSGGLGFQRMPRCVGERVSEIGGALRVCDFPEVAGGRQVVYSLVNDDGSRIGDGSRLGGYCCPL